MELSREVEQVKERVKNGHITIAEIGQFIKAFSDKIEQKMEKMKDLEQRIADYRERISQLEKEKQRVREEIRELNVLIGEIQDTIKAIGFVATSKVSERPRGKGQRVYVKVTEAGVKAGLVGIAGEFDSMARALYALKPEMTGKRTDFKRKLEVLAEQGLIELQFL